MRKAATRPSDTLLAMRMVSRSEVTKEQLFDLSPAIEANEEKLMALMALDQARGEAA